ncbi:MAG: response regulator transcription factor [Sphingobacteriales bacterium]|nr:MAG: response regulator transcription factor [Sphingobacteriales bacterium]
MLIHNLILVGAKTVYEKLISELLAPGTTIQQLHFLSTADNLPGLPLNGTGNQNLIIMLPEEPELTKLELNLIMRHCAGTPIIAIGFDDDPKIKSMFLNMGIMAYLPVRDLDRHLVCAVTTVMQINLSLEQNIAISVKPELSSGAINKEMLHRKSLLLPREREYLYYRQIYGPGQRKTIATVMDAGISTVEKYITSIYKKLGISSNEVDNWLRLYWYPGDWLPAYKVAQR